MLTSTRSGFRDYCLLIAQLAEPPDADPHVRWCDRESWRQPTYVDCGGRMTEIIFVVHEPPEGGYAAEALGHSIYTVADDLEELNDMVRDAVICHFDDEASRP